MNNIKLEIADFLGYCDLNGTDAVTSDMIERLEYFIDECNKAMNGEGIPIVADAIYDRLVEILKAVNPDDDLLRQVWSEDEGESLDDIDIEDLRYSLLRQEPMKSICTCKSFDCQELLDFVKRLPDGDFDAHISCKENGHGIRLVYCYGALEDATSRARNSAGHNITRQMNLILGRDGLDNIVDLADDEVIEIRGEVLLPFANLEKARSFNPQIKSAFSGVSSMLRDSASEEETNLLDFVAYKVVSNIRTFNTKSEEYDFLESLGFTTPLYWLVDGFNNENLLNELPGIVSQCENEVKHDENGEGGYEYYTDGLVFEVNDRSLFNSMGDDGGKYNYGNIALKVGYWSQDLLTGYVQTILWADGKTKYSPVAIVAEDIDMAEFYDSDGDTGYEDVKPYIKSIKEIANWTELGVTTPVGNKVRRVPLYEPANMALLQAYVGMPIYFRYGGEAGVVPCFSDGTVLSDAKIRSVAEDDIYDEDGEYWG